MPAATAPTTDRAAGARDALTVARERTLALVSPISDPDLEKVHSTLMSPLVWDLGHIAAFEDLWLVHRAGGEAMLREDLCEIYDAFETPRAHRGDLPFLDPPAARDYLGDVRARVLDLIEAEGVGDGLFHELVIQHELQHCETMLQAIELARLGHYQPIEARGLPGAPTTHSGLELIDIPAGAFELGAPGDRFAYDNERPRHVVDCPAFAIGRTPVTNATYRSFIEAGGYQQRENWSEQGWAWRSEHEISRPAGWTDDGGEWRVDGCESLDPAKPVSHVSWFEADAFARAHDARLPTETEWEKAATWDPRTASTGTQPWGQAPPSAELANLGQTGFGPSQAGAFPDGASPCGALGMIGDLWEWTSSPLGGYPGFEAYPYREYSEVFFGDEYRVLRGGSWATDWRVATPTFRNWDLPQRRQIFSGLRIARAST